MKRSIIIEIICCLLAVLFTYAAISKLLEFNEFKLQLSKSPFIANFSNLLALILPFGELGAVLLLIVSRTRLAGLYFSLFLLSLFTTYLIAMLNLSYYIPCSCGGVLSSLSWKQHVILNLFFLAISITGIMMHDNTQKELATCTSQKNIKNYLQIQE